jgi:hypothetical protein
VVIITCDWESSASQNHVATGAAYYQRIARYQPHWIEQLKCFGFGGGVTVDTKLVNEIYAKITDSSQTDFQGFSALFIQLIM